MSLVRWSSVGARYGFPRVSGDEPRAPRYCTITLRFSPRERG